LTKGTGRNRAAAWNLLAGFCLIWENRRKLKQEVAMSLAELERRVHALEDAEEIRKLHQNYINMMDNLQYGRVLELFTEDALVEVRQSGVKKGRKELSEIYENLARIRGTVRYDAHLAVEPDITVDGDTASGVWLIYMLFSKPAIQWVQGRNECEYRKENGDWKISRLKFTRTLASDPALYP
jgi:ketosteroid isomerase-like protein